MSARIAHSERNVFDSGPQALELLQELPQGCVLVNQDAQPVFVNRAAKRILTDNSTVRLESTGLTAARQEDDARLRSLVSRAANGRPCGGEMAIYRERGQPVLIFVNPIRARYQPPTSSDATAAVWISDPEDRSFSRSRRIRTIFELTCAEAALASEIAGGMTLIEIANSRNISRHTVRNQLKSIFAKTGARCQADLVRLVLSCPD
jgi:DNA-binding CsgD family transcriptional regulator